MLREDWSLLSFVAFSNQGLNLERVHVVNAWKALKGLRGLQNSVLLLNQQSKSGCLERSISDLRRVNGLRALLLPNRWLLPPSLQLLPVDVVAAKAAALPSRLLLLLSCCAIASS